jgi:chromosomal replication initiation ATPase DnaA
MPERITEEELRQLARLADKARRSYRNTRPALAGRFETAAATAVHMADIEERVERLTEIHQQLEQVTMELGLPD